MKKILIVICFIIIMILPVWAWGAYYCVKSSGSYLGSSASTTDIASFGWLDEDCYPTIQAACAAVTDLDTIVLYSGTHILGGGTTTELPMAMINLNNDTDYETSVVEFSSSAEELETRGYGTTTIKGITFRNHPSGSGRSCIKYITNISQSSTLNITACRFYNNTKTSGTPEAGSAIVSSNNGTTAAINVSDSIFDNNTTYERGCISLDTDLSGTFTGCIFSGNIANRRGAAISCRNNTTLILSDCTFYNNEVLNVADNHNRGGAVWIDGSSGICSLTVSVCDFEGNTSAGGGAIWTNNTNVTIDDTAFSDNNSTGSAYWNWGGAICALDSAVTITDSSFLNNSSNTRGGAIKVTNANVSIIGTIFSGNKSKGDEVVGGQTGSGVAIHVNDLVFDSSSYYFTMTDCIVENNEWDDSACNVADGTILVKGAGSNDKYIVTVTDCTFQDNYSKQGAGFYAGRYTEANFERCLFRENLAKRNGGGCYKGGGPPSCLGEKATLNFCSFIGNRAGWDRSGVNGGGSGVGGAFSTRVYPQIEMNNCSFNENKARVNGDSISKQRDGNAFDNDLKRITLTNCIFYGSGTDEEIYADDNTVDYAFKSITYCALESGEFNANAGLISDNVILTTNPFLSLSDSHLSLNSPCRNAGTDSIYSGQITDADGMIVTDANGDAIDEMPIGAYLYVESGVGCDGDFDGDGDVDGSDLAVFAADFGRTDCHHGEPCEGDFENDGDVDGSDLAVFATDFGRTDCP